MIQIQKATPQYTVWTRASKGQGYGFDYSNKQAIQSIHPVTTIDEDIKGVIDNVRLVVRYVKYGEIRLAKVFASNAQLLLDRIETKRGEQ